MGHPYSLACAAGLDEERAWMHSFPTVLVRSGPSPPLLRPAPIASGITLDCIRDHGISAVTAITIGAVPSFPLTNSITAKGSDLLGWIRR